MSADKSVSTASSPNSSTSPASLLDSTCSSDALCNDYIEDLPLFSPAILSDLLSQSHNIPSLSMLNKSAFRIRPLQLNDYDNGYMQLLKQLTVVGEVTKKQFHKQFSLTRHSGLYYIIVVEDVNTHALAGTGTLVIEQKFIHNCTPKGRIEDIVVDESFRKRGIGKLLLEVLLALGDQVGCYKLTLECTEQMMPFYEQFRFQHNFSKYNFMFKVLRDC